MTKNEFTQVPGYYRLLVGDIEVICVNDGSLSSDINAVRGVSTAECSHLFAESFFPAEPRCTTNVFIIRSQGRTALIDTGGGPHLDATAGKLLENATAAGVSPKDIDMILFTHVHPDHVSGLLDANNGKVFPHVTIKMARSEKLFWLSDKPASKEIEHVKHEADHVVRFLTPYADQIEPFVDGEVFPGVTAVPLPGHTPGHTGYLIKSGDEELLIWGDVIHWPIVQFRRPDAAMSYDVDPVQAAATRRRVLEEAASSGRLVAGMHLFFPGLTRVRRDGDALRDGALPLGARRRDPVLRRVQAVTILHGNKPQRIPSQNGRMTMKYNRLYAYGLIATVGLALTTNHALAQDDKSVSVLHYWTAGGEAAAMNAAKTAFEKLGGKWIDQPVSGGGGDTHDQVLRSRILAGDAPSAAIPKVADAKSWYDEGYLVNIDAVAEKEKWDSVLPASIADVLKVDGHYVSVPTNIHRFNAMWANAEILKEHGIEMPKTWDEFNAAAEKLKAAGIVPLAHGGQSWQESILFEIVVAGIGGPEFFRKTLVEYDEASLKSDTMIKVFDQLRKLRSDVDPNFSGRDWNIATSMVIKGEATFQFMGDWAKGEVTAAKVAPGVDILCSAAPSNFPGVFLYVANSFTFFKTGDGNVTSGQELLASTLMTSEVQANFNLAKGSVPAVTGIDLSKFDRCAQDTAQDLAAADNGNTLLPALNGGMLSSGEMRGAVADAITKFFNSDLSSQEGVELLLKQIDTAR